MRARSLALVAILALGIASCGSGEAADPPSSGGGDPKPAGGVDLSDKDFEDLTAESDVEVQGRDNRFVAPYIEVKAGTPITFDNKGRNQHNVLPVEKGAFKPIDTAEFEPGESATLTLEKPGDYPYYCSLHGTKTKGMVGAIRVLE